MSHKLMIPFSHASIRLAAGDKKKKSQVTCVYLCLQSPLLLEAGEVY